MESIAKKRRKWKKKVTERRKEMRECALGQAGRFGILNRLSTHKYRECAELAPEVFRISASSLSKRFKYTTAAKLKQLQERRLDKYDFVSIFIDGKRYADDGLMIALGITIEGQKVILGIEQLATSPKGYIRYGAPNSERATKKQNTKRPSAR